MATREYCEFNAVKYRVIREGYSQMGKRAKSVRFNADGQSDVVESPTVVTRFRMMLRVNATDVAGYGTIATLRTLFAYTATIAFLSPDGGATVNVRIASDLIPQNITPVLDGANAYFIVPIELIVVT